MTVINGTREHSTLLGNAYQVFAPKARAAARSPRRRALTAWLRDRATQIRSITLSTIGVGAPTAAAYTWHVWAGLVATGLAALVMDLAVDVAKGKRGGDVPAR